MSLAEYSRIHLDRVAREKPRATPPFSAVSVEGDGLLVHRDGFLRDLLPRELVDAALPSGLPELFGELGITGEAVHLGREVRLEGGDEVRVGCRAGS